MLNENDFKALYEKFYGTAVKYSHSVYSDYLIDVNMFEDYLDIFRGKNTREDRKMFLSDNWYYEHPFFNGIEPKLAKVPLVKFIMIGEAKPVQRQSEFNECQGDLKNTYFYNVTHLKNTRWLSEPFKAFHSTNQWYKISCPKEKVKILLELASKGYLLIDLFPFPFPSPVPNSLRNRLNESGVSSYFFNSYLKALLSKVKKINTEKDCVIAFSGPSTIHHYLTHELAFGKLTLPKGFICKLQVNYFVQPISISSQIQSALTNWYPEVNLLNNQYRNPGVKQAPFYRCEVWDGSNTGPHWLFIQNAFF